MTLVRMLILLLAALPGLTACDLLPSRAKTAFVADSAMSYTRQQLAFGPRDPKGAPDQPDPTVILMRRIGRGKAVVNLVHLSPQEKKNLEIATVEFKDILQYGHVELAEMVMAPTYIQHNPNVPTGRAAFVDFFSKVRKPEPIKAEWKDKPKLTIVSGSYVFMMFKRENKDPDDPTKTYPAYWFDMVRVDSGMVQEHWDAAVKNPPAAR